MWGIVPAAGAGRCIQPFAFSEELVPVGGEHHEATDRPRAVSQYLLDRMLYAGATRICIVIAAGTSDIVEYYGAAYRLDADVHGASEPRSTAADLCYVVQPKSVGLCDALFRALPLIAPDDPVLVGLPDTVWFPVDGLALLRDDMLSFLLFDVDRPELFDAVLTDECDAVREIRVKSEDAGTSWVWGAFRLPGRVLAALHDLWLSRGCRDEYLGTLVNAYLATGGRAHASRKGELYVDVGTLHGYRESMRGLAERIRSA